MKKGVNKVKINSKIIILTLFLTIFLSNSHFNELKEVPIANNYLLHNPNASDAIYDFEDQTLYAQPSWTTLNVIAPVGSGSITVETLGDAQQKHAAINKTGGSDQLKLDLNCTPSDYYMRGNFSYKIRVGNTMNFIFAGDHYQSFLGFQMYQGNIRAYPSGTFLGTYPLNAWANITVHFDLEVGWMFDFNGVRYGNGYAYQFYNSDKYGLRTLSWRTGWSGTDTSGIIRIDDIDYHLSNDTAPSFAPIAPTIVPHQNPELEGNFEIDWNDIQDVSIYRLYRSTSYIDSIDELNLIYEGSESYYMESLDVRGVYYYAVVASNSSGDSPLSIVESVEYRFPYPSEVVVTNNVWLTIQAGIMIEVELIDIYSIAHMCILISTAKNTEIRLNYYTKDNSLPTKLEDGREYWKIEFYDLEDWSDASITAKFYYNTAGLTLKEQENLVLYEYNTNSWVKSENQVLSVNNVQIVQEGVVSGLFSIKIDDNEEPANNNTPFNIPGYSIYLLLFGIGFTLFAKVYLYKKRK
jgi:hypothetical protein